MHEQITRAAGDDDFAALFEETVQSKPEIKEGSIVKGTVVDIIGDYAVVDIGMKARFSQKDRAKGRSDRHFVRVSSMAAA